MKLYLHMRQSDVTVLGPGNRYVVWVAGCNRRCKDCIAPQTWDMKKGDPIEVGALASEIIAKKPDGITISGGEPFLQAQALAQMLRLVRNKLDIGVIVYTGYKKEELDSVENSKELLDRTDLLIDGPYIKELDDSKSLRGSSNQRVWDLTGRYTDKLYLYGTQDRQAQVFRHSDAIHYVGIPTDSEYKTEI